MAHCPICQSKTAKAFRPFCSKRCADVDLGRWMNEAYAAPAVEEDDVSPAEAQAAAELRDKLLRDPGGSIH